ncbi:uncharacterized protein LOC129573001, partial [Sitodiplosis mosellana]|uniref:uncharacterized protein LOC129573001 n=1 Tax=Sitodiplosis mosellana TaxID=263140 RepID=UPI002444168F
SEKDKLKSYASKIDRLRKELSIIEHQQEIAKLNLSLLEVTLSETNSECDPSATKTAASSGKSINTSVPNRKPSEKPIQKLPNTSSGSQVQSMSDVQCFNCSDYGHYSANCTKKRRVKGSCFNCGSLQHILKD